MEKLSLQQLDIPYCNPQKQYLIAGPCSAETEEQVLTTAHELAQNGVRIFRAGIWKPRTKPGGFEGIGSIGLEWLKRVRQETGMLVATEVATAKHVEECLKAEIDIFWIGARTTANPFAVQEIADTLQGESPTVFIKNPVNPDIELWIGAFERLNNAGITKLGAIHRGFSSYEQKKYRNQPHWHIPIELKRRIPQLPILCDPSHIGGKRELIAPLSQQAMDLGFNGLIIETHCCPENAWSDAMQQITPETLKHLIDLLIVRKTSNEEDELRELRRQIDACDSTLIEILAKRLSIAKEIGMFKKENNLTILQTNRYSQILQKRIEQGGVFGMDEEFIQKIFEMIHEESVRVQMSIVDDNSTLTL